MRKQCKRKHLDPMASIRRRSGLANDQLSDLALRYQTAMLAYRFGAGNADHFGTLAVSTRLSDALCKANVLPHYHDAVLMAQIALMTMHEAGRNGFTGDELKVMMRFTAIHDHHLAVAPVGLIEKCLVVIGKELE